MVQKSLKTPLRNIKMAPNIKSKKLPQLCSEFHFQTAYEQSEPTLLMQTQGCQGFQNIGKSCQEFKKNWWLTIPLTLCKIKNHYRKTNCLSKDLCTPLYNGSIHCHHRICQHKSKNYRDHDLSQAWP